MIDGPLTVVDVLAANAMGGRCAVPIWLGRAPPPTAHCCVMRRPRYAGEGSRSRRPPIGWRHHHAARCRQAAAPGERCHTAQARSRAARTPPHIHARNPRHEVCGRFLRLRTGHRHLQCPARRVELGTFTRRGQHFVVLDALDARRQHVQHQAADELGAHRPPWRP